MEKDTHRENLILRQSAITASQISFAKWCGEHRLRPKATQFPNMQALIVIKVPLLNVKHCKR